MPGSKYQAGKITVPLCESLFVFFLKGIGPKDALLILRSYCPFWAQAIIIRGSYLIFSHLGPSHQTRKTTFWMRRLAGGGGREAEKQQLRVIN